MDIKIFLSLKKILLIITAIECQEERRLHMRICSVGQRQNKFPFCSEVVMMDTSFSCYFFPAHTYFLDMRIRAGQ